MAPDPEGDTDVDWNVVLGSVLTGDGAVAKAFFGFLTLQRESFKKDEVLRNAFLDFISLALKEKEVWKDVPFTQALAGKAMLRSVRALVSLDSSHY